MNRLNRFIAVLLCFLLLLSNLNLSYTYNKIWAADDYSISSSVYDSSGNTISLSTYQEYIKQIKNTVENPKWTWTSNGKTVTNLPITNWKRSSNFISGSLSNLNWNNFNSLVLNITDQSQVWDGSRSATHNYNNYLGSNKISAYNGKLSDSATWLYTLTEGSYTPQLWRFQGSFTVDKSLNLSDMYFTMDSVCEDSVTYLNDFMFVLIYPKEIKNLITTDSNSQYYYMNFLAMYHNISGDSYKGVYSPTYYLPSNYLSGNGCVTGWRTNTVPNNAGKAIYNGYNLLKNSSEYTGEYIVDIIAGDRAGGGGMYRVKIGAEFKDTSIAYAANGGIGSMETDTKTSTTSGTPSFTIKENEFVKEGYSFAGWNTAIDGTGTSYYPGQIYTSNDSLILYAQWKIANANYKVLHQQEQLDGTYTTVDTENLTGTIGTSVTPAVKSYTGFTSPATRTVTIAADGSTTVTYKYARKVYDLDVNTILDGTTYSSGVDGITFEVYVNGSKVGSGKDFCVRDTYKYDSTYEIKNISCSGYTFDTSSSIKGTLTADTVVTPKFTTNSYNATYKDVIDSISGTVLGQSTASKKYGTSVRGSELGNSTADNAYYNGYYYVSDTSDTVGTSGATVYRIFNLRTLDISGTVAWTDNSNKWGTRPNSIEVYLYRDGEQIDTTTGLVNSESNEYSFKNLPKYSTSDGHVYNYTVSQSEAVSKTSPEDKYTTTQNTYDFINVLSNTDTDTDSKGLTVSGSIYWEDNGNSLGYRPSTVTITLYQNGEEYKTVEVDTFNNNTYEFIKLPKYDNDLNKYEYTVEETVIANYLVKENGNYVLKDAYTVKADTPNPLDFTNVFNIPSEPPIPVKPEYTNTVTIKTNTEDKIAISLKGMETIINDDLSVSYGTSYNGQVYNVSANNVGEVLSSIGSGKYEISYYNTAYILNDINCTGDSNIWIEGNGDTYYLVIKDTNSNISGTITLDFSKKDHIGYQSDVSASNYFKVKIETETSTTLETQVFALSRVTVTAENIYSVIYENSDTIDDNIYNEGDEVEVLNYEGKVPEGNEFIGWSLTEDSEEPNYQVGDVITIENKDISLYPVFKEIEEFTETKTTEVRETETTDTKDSEETGESSKEETSQEESILKEESFQIEEISTENISSTEESIVEKESSETSESSEIEE